jgi:hypothetical protein
MLQDGGKCKVLQVGGKCKVLQDRGQKLNGTVHGRVFVHIFNLTRRSLIMSMGRGYVFELRPPPCLLFIPQVIFEHGEAWWNDVDRGKLILPPERCLGIVPAEPSSSKSGGPG